MSLSCEIRRLAQKAEETEHKLILVTERAYVLCRTLGYCHGEGGAAFIGPPSVQGFPDTETAIRQLIDALGNPSRGEG